MDFPPGLNWLNAIERSVRRPRPAVTGVPTPGTLKGKIEMAEDFDAPVDMNGLTLPGGLRWFDSWTVKRLPSGEYAAELSKMSIGISVAATGASAADAVTYAVRKMKGEVTLRINDLMDAAKELEGVE